MKAATPSALIAVGVMFIVLGMTSSRGLIGAGVVFLIAGIVEHRKSRNSDEGPHE